jgi:hypothetical protein
VPVPRRADPPVEKAELYDPVVPQRIEEALDVRTP